ncbi:hypothetical protein ACH5RR_009086 [Cinchona calisaya]|uniref:Uncharacterized protein n=1 Tax=Cinchona calisaya TaxID=153742 RepID=A0ABD3ADK5_9GENT
MPNQNHGACEFCGVNHIGGQCYMEESSTYEQVMERTRKKTNVDTTTGIGDDQIHDAKMEIPVFNLVHGSRNTASRVDQGIPRVQEPTFNVETTATSSQAVLNGNGGLDPDVALNCIAQTETKFKALKFLEDVKVQVVILFLVGDADNW